MSKPVFVDAQEMARLHPSTFEAPCTADLACIGVGNFVKVCTCDERFWVEVTAVTPKAITGNINNDLVFTHAHGLRDGDSVTFERRHVYNIWEE